MKKFNQFLEEAVTVTVTGESAEEVDAMLKLLKNQNGEVDEAVKYGTTLSNNGAYNALTLGKHVVMEETLLKEETKSGDSSLHDWFSKSKSSDGKRGWVQLGGKYAGKSCAKQPGQTTKPKCGSSKMAANMSDKEEDAAARRKRAQDPNPNRSGAPINVPTEGKRKMKEETVDEACWAGYEKKGMKTMFGKRYPNCVKKESLDEYIAKNECPECGGHMVSEDKLTEEKDACYHKVKSRYSVWPSAYASGALVKCRKAGADNWGNKTKKENVELKSFKSFINEAANPAQQAAIAIDMKKKGIKPKNEEVEELDEVAAWQRKEGKNPEGGLNRKGVESYRRENPGSKLSTAVTTEPSKLKPGSKSANRRKSFCARMSGMKRRLTSAKTANDPDSRINKSLRKWNC